MLFKKNQLSEIRGKLKNDNLDIRIAAVDQLGEAGSEVCIRELCSLLSDDSRNLKIAVLNALGRHEGPLSVNGLINALKDNSEKVAREAARLLGSFNPSTAIIDSLLDVLAASDVSMYIKSQVEKSLSGYGEIVMSPLLGSMETGGQELQKRSAETLALMGESRAVEPIICMLESPDQGTRLVAVEALGKLGEHGVDALLKILPENNVALRRRAVQSLGEIGADRASQPLIKLLEDKDVYVRGYAARALGEICNPEAVPALMKSLYNCNWDCTGALVKIGEPAFEPLLKGIFYDKVGVRTRVANALKEIGGEKVVPHMIEAMESKSWGVRITAIEILRCFHSEEAFAALIEALDDDYWNVRKTAVEALQMFDKEKVSSHITKMLDDEDEIVRRCASDALNQLNRADTII